MEDYIIIKGEAVFVGDELEINGNRLEVLSIYGDVLILDGGLKVNRADLEAE